MPPSQWPRPGVEAKPGACGVGANSTLSTTADFVGSSICDQAAITIMMCAALPVTMFWITSAWSSAAVLRMAGLRGQADVVVERRAALPRCSA